MRRSSLLAAVVLAGLAGGNDSGSEGAVAKAKPSASPKCSIAAIKANAKTGKVSALGGCRVRGRSVPAVWGYRYTAYDHQGYRCGDRPSTGKVRVFSLRPPGAFRATVHFTLKAKPRKGQRRGKPARPRSRTVMLRGKLAQCAKLDQIQLPSPAKLCPWSEPAWGSICGSPTPGSRCAWSSLATFVNGVVSSGNIACRSGNCWLEPYHPKLKYVVWLGYRAATVNFSCADGLYLNLRTWQVTLLNPSGQTCGPVRLPFPHILAFKVPPSWGGIIRVMWVLQGGGGQEVMTGEFRLTGTEDGCPQLLAEGES